MASRSLSDLRGASAPLPSTLKGDDVGNSIKHTTPSTGGDGPSGTNEPSVQDESASSPLNVEEATSTLFTSPTGLEIYYQWAPKRIYRVNGVEVPSVTTPLELIGAFGAGAWWGQGIGIDGALQWAAYQGVNLSTTVVTPGLREEVLDWMKKEGLTVHAARDKAAERGINVHDALEAWADHGILPVPENYPETERVYVESLLGFLKDFGKHVHDVHSEIMTASVHHGFAGRFDLVVELKREVEYNARCYPKRKPLRSTLPAGRYLFDLKTSGKIQDKFFYQMAAYRRGMEESHGWKIDGYGVLRVDGERPQYELVLGEDYGHDLRTYLAVQTAWKMVNRYDERRGK